MIIQDSPKMALKGIRIIDFGQGAIGPMTTSYLADFGAEVIKVESFGAIDFIRRTEHFVNDVRDPDKNFHFSRYNQNKLGVLINLKRPEGVELAKKLVSIADVVMENLALPAFQKMGLSYEVLRKVKPDIIMLSSSFGGQTGPYKYFRGQGYIIAALQGLDDITGWPDKGIVSPAGAFCDHYLPWVWSCVILAALEYRRRTGKGQFIDASSLEGCLDILDTAVADYSVNKRILKRQGNRSQTSAPHGVFRCKGNERWCALAISNEQDWQNFCREIGNPSWVRERRFETTEARRDHADELEPLIEDWTLQFSAEEIMHKLQAAGVAAGVVENIKDLFEDPQLAFREHFWESKQPGMEAYTFEAPSARLTKTPGQFQRPGPLMGEHNDYVFSELLKLKDDDYNQLVVNGIIG
jgi:benzylsuccinate CoA-transferase BbsF subunit